MFRRDFIFDNFWFWTESYQQSNVHLGLFLFEIRLLLDFWTSGLFVLICLFIYFVIHPVIYCLFVDLESFFVVVDITWFNHVRI